LGANGTWDVDEKLCAGIESDPFWILLFVMAAVERIMAKYIEGSAHERTD
jgi:hypothetical protein